MSEPRDQGPGDEPVGSVGEEAAKLFGALSGWAREHGSDVGDGVSGLAGHAAAAYGEINEHLATDSPECTYCPVCRAVHVVRQTSPEVRAHLTTAASSLLQAAAGLLATIPPPPSSTSSGPSSGPGPDFQRIDLDPDLGEDDR